jgi:hypothetical protein
MRYRRHMTHPRPVEPAAAVDASGHVWNPELYRVDEAGNPLLTSSGNYWLKPGKSHPSEETESSEEA